MTENYLILLDRGHLRIYVRLLSPGQSTPSFEISEAMDFPAGKSSYSSHTSDQAGRFPGFQGRAGGMSIDERLPMQEERDHRLVDEMSEHMNAFLRVHPRANWLFAAGPPLHRAVLEKIEPAAKERLRQAVNKDLVNQPPSELHSYFAA